MQLATMTTPISGEGQVVGTVSVCDHTSCQTSVRCRPMNASNE